ncbi:MAG TPA: hypothetical protein VFX86_02215 [Candidatus Saccharimonadales bacterium]|nr:hypothetical protein [Candidatus Saccharimonadales bacterium]
MIKKLNTGGSVLVSMVIIFPFFIVILTAYMNHAVSGFRTARSDQFRTSAQFSTDAGIDHAMQEINIDDSWSGTGSEVELQNSNGIRTTYEVSVTDVDEETKLVTSIGRTYHPGNSTPEFSVTINAELRAVSSGQYSIVTGVGGLLMQNSAKIMGGDVLINGEIEMQNSAQIGLATNSVVVEVAHQNCPDPPDSTYPRICNSGENGQPISINNSAHIYGSVSANNQTDGSDMSDPGLVAGSGVAAQPLPEHDRDAQKAAISSTIDDSAAECDFPFDNSVTWPANLKIEGDVSISNGCEVTLEGDVWITGRLSVQNSARIIIPDDIALGNTINPELPTIMIDGSAGLVLQNSAEIVSNSNDVGAQVITYWSRAGCSPDCAEVTGQDLYDTRGDRTILLQNSADAPNSIMYARWSQVEIGNGGAIGAVVGQTVRLSNSAIITFGTSAPGGGSTFWVIDGYRRSF